MTWTPRRRRASLMVMRVVKWKWRRWRFLIKAAWVMPFSSPRWKAKEAARL